MYDLLKQSLTRSVDLDDHNIWTSTLAAVPENVFKQSLKTAIGMLLHNANLHHWNLSPTDCYPLQGKTDIVSFHKHSLVPSRCVEDVTDQSLDNTIPTILSKKEQKMLNKEEPTSIKPCQRN